MNYIINNKFNNEYMNKYLIKEKDIKNVKDKNNNITNKTDEIESDISEHEI